MTDWELTCEGEDWAVRSAAGQEVGHVAAPGVHKDGPGTQAVGHGGRACAELLALPAFQLLCQGFQHQMAMLLLPADRTATLTSTLRFGDSPDCVIPSPMKHKSIFVLHNIPINVR